MDALEDERAAHWVCVKMRDDALAEVARLHVALKPFAEIGQRLHAANQLSDQSKLIAASARFLMLDPLTGQDFVNAHIAIEQLATGGKE